MGIIYILISGAAFGLLPWFAHISYDHGAEPLGMLTARFSIAAILMTGRHVLRKPSRPWPKRKLFAQLFLLGALGYSVQSAFYLYGMKRIDISLATVIFYMFPMFVVLASWLFFRHSPTRAMLLCLPVTVIGAVLTGGQVKSGSWIGILLMLSAALWYTGYILISSRLVHIAGAPTSLMIVMIGAAVANLALWSIQRFDLPNDITGWAAITGAVVVSTILAMGLFFAGVSRIGPGEAAVLSTIEPVVSILVGVVALNEVLTPVRVLGATLVLVGVTTLAQLSRRTQN
ncbi:MAG: hypothetical protein EXQ63_07410 [Ilumatobacteraceae bacterium]|nr:hypothetical protein [Ilumatobacteraceae bacterium]